MKNTVKKMISLVLIATLLFSGSSMVFAEAYGPEVMLNGQYVEFPDAAPENVDGRIMVPFRPILEALGATVEWDPETKTVTAVKGDETLNFTIGESEVAVTSPEGEKTSEMDVVPYVKNDRTYVGTRFMAEALDYTVGWDSDAESVIIIDFDEIFANVEEDFSIMNLAATTEPADMETTYETTMNMSLSVALAAAALGMPEDLEFSVAGDIDALTKGMDADMSMTLNLDIDQIVDLLAGDTSEMTEEELAALNEMVETLKTIEMDIKMDSETGDMFIRCPLIAQLEANEAYTEDTWYQMNIYDVYADMGVDFQEIMDMATTGEVDMTVMFDSVKETLAADMGVETYDAIVGVYGALKAVFGDEAFVKTSSGGVNTYTSEFNGETILEGFIASVGDEFKAQYAAMTDEEKQEISSLLDGIAGSFVLKEKDGVLVESEVTFEMDIEGVQLGMYVKGDKENAELMMNLSIPEMAMIEIMLDATSKESTQTVDVTIPEGSPVVDLMAEAMPQPVPEEAPANVVEEAPASK